MMKFLPLCQEKEAKTKAKVVRIIFSYLTDTLMSLWIYFREFNMDVFIIYKFCVFNVGHTVEIRAEYFALVCAPCLEQLSDKTRMRPLGTCTSKGHIVKVLTF